MLLQQVTDKIQEIESQNFSSLITLQIKTLNSKITKGP